MATSKPTLRHHDKPPRVDRLVLVEVTPAGFDALDPIPDRLTSAVDDGRAGTSSVFLDKRYAFDEPSTDERPWPLAGRLIGPVTRSRISGSDFLVVLAGRNRTDPLPGEFLVALARRNRTDARPVVRCHIARLYGAF